MTKWHGGKGSSRRKGANDNLFAQNYDKIFGKKKELEMTNVVVYSKPHCPYCDKAKALLTKMNVKFEAKMLDEDFTREDLMEVAPTARTFPQVFINGKNVGGYDQLKTYIETTNFNGTGFTL